MITDFLYAIGHTPVESHTSKGTSTAQNGVDKKQEEEEEENTNLGK